MGANEREIRYRMLALARAFLMVFVIISVVGLVFFLGNIKVMAFLYWLAAAICAAVISAVPIRIIEEDKLVKIALIFVSFIGIMAISGHIYQDFDREHGLDLPGILLNIFFALCFLIYFWQLVIRISANDADQK